MTEIIRKIFKKITIFEDDLLFIKIGNSIELCRNGSVTLHIIIIKNAGLRSMRVKYKEENSL